MTKFFTSDTHFGHKAAALRFRDFASVEEMNEVMIERWNATVGLDDEVYHLGDFGMASCRKVLIPILERLNGHIHLVMGNHDRGCPRHFLDRFVTSDGYKEIKIGDRKVVLNHYAMRVWNMSHYGSFMLYGHSHGNLPGFGRSMDIGVDTHDMTPYHEDEIVAVLEDIEPIFVDHHTEETNP